MSNKGRILASLSFRHFIAHWGGTHSNYVPMSPDTHIRAHIPPAPPHLTAPYIIKGSPDLYRPRIIQT